MLYSVHIYIENSFAKDWYEWMLRVHIPDVMRTRCFIGTKFSELIEPAKAGYQGYIIQYNTTEERLANINQILRQRSKQNIQLDMKDIF